jgi:T5orf172 domain
MGWVYILKAHINAGYGQSLIKIGMSNKRDFNDRVESIQAEWLNVRRVEVSILAIEQCQNALDSEQKLHHKFKDYSATIGQIRSHLGGACSGDSEWFLVPDSLIDTRIKPAADRLSDRPDYGHYSDPEDFPWMGLTVMAGLILFAIAGRTNPSPPPLTVFAPNYSGANIRKSPNGPIMGFAANGSGVTVKGRSGQWCQTGDGWIWCEYLR